jgi:hypothetical protein
MDEVHRWRERPRLPGVLPGQRWIRRISYPGAAGSGGEAPSLRLSADKRRITVTISRRRRAPLVCSEGQDVHDALVVAVSNLDPGGEVMVQVRRLPPWSATDGQASSRFR